jgi:hypothetical protein
MKRLRHLGFVLWLALALGLGQLGAALHGLAHATEKVSQRQDSKPAPSKCDECPLFAQLGSAVGSKGPATPVVALASPRPILRSERSASVAARLAFRSRAPPTLL